MVFVQLLGSEISHLIYKYTNRYGIMCACNIIFVMLVFCQSSVLHAEVYWTQVYNMRSVVWKWRDLRALSPRQLFFHRTSFVFVSFNWWCSQNHCHRDIQIVFSVIPRHKSELFWTQSTRLASEIDMRGMKSLVLRIVRILLPVSVRAGDGTRFTLFLIAIN